MDRECEVELVGRLRRGDPEAFDRIHAAFNGRLFSFLTRLSRSRDRAEDLLEETWMRLVAHATRLHPETRLGPWLFTVAHNLYVSYCRSRAIEQSYLEDGGGLWPVNPEPSPLESTAAGELQRRVDAELGRIPAIYREAILLVAGEGIDPGEAAQICGVSGATMRQRLKRGRQMLAERLAASEMTGLSENKL